MSILDERNERRAAPWSAWRDPLEQRVSEVMASEERARVQRATMEALERADTAAQVRRAVCLERIRCLRVAEQWPDNLMARRIAFEIKEGI